MTRDQLADLISQARDADGEPFTIEDLDTRGHKTSKHLLDEIQVTDVILSVDTTINRLVAARITGLLSIEHDGWEFHEVGRRFPDGKEDWTVREHGLRETRRLNEDIKTSIRWGILEELGILIAESELFETREQQVRNILGKTLDYESSVFYAVLTRALFREYTWRPFACPTRTMLLSVLRSKNPRQLTQELLSVWNRLFFWVRFKMGMITVVKERDGVRVYGRWNKKT